MFKGPSGTVKLLDHGKEILRGGKLSKGKPVYGLVDLHDPGLVVNIRKSKK